MTDGNEVYSTEVPGSILKTLLDHKVIPDPFDALNEQLGTDATKKPWIFERTFDISKKMLSHDHVNAVFEGLDTLAKIELNGAFIADTDNMHRTWRFSVKELLREGKNSLRITFSPALDYVKQAGEADPGILYDGGSELRGTWALRKAHYMFGWDWGPCLPDAGIWRDVTLEAYDTRLEDVRIRQEHQDGKVTLFISAVTDAEELSATVSDSKGRIVSQAESGADETAVLPIPSPELWWPNGLGVQPLYTVRVTAKNGSETMDERTFRIGLRTMTVSRDPDEWGEEFAFTCNGVKFFAMGADYIPEDNLLTRMTKEKTARLLEDCREANFNTIRVWGGGIYPGDDFFDLCDEKGLVVWQDLMFACNTYRLTDSFRESIAAEAKDNIRRIRHHASLGLICGNNEMETAWSDWKGVMDQSDDLKNDYLEQFEHLLKDISLQEAPDVFYWPSSPSSGGSFDAPNDLNRGDVHDWSVWHGRRPFSDFTKRYPRFCSEFGFESFPDMKTLKTFIHSEKDMNPFSRVMESHQKCHSGNSTMLYYLAQTLPYPYSMERLVHSTQYLQGEAMRAGVEHWRRNRGRCMGAVVWQLNDCWPVASWASIDSLGRWKALHYAEKRFFAPVLLSCQAEQVRSAEACSGNSYADLSAALNISNETREEKDCLVSWSLRDAKGNIIRQGQQRILIPALSAVWLEKLLFPNEPVYDRYFSYSLQICSEEVSQGAVLFCPPKHFDYADPSLTCEQEGDTLIIRSSAFVQAVEIECEDGDVIFSDNFFDMGPGKKRVRIVRGKGSRFRLHSLWDAR